MARHAGAGDADVALAAPPERDDRLVDRHLASAVRIVDEQTRSCHAGLTVRIMSERLRPSGCNPLTSARYTGSFLNTSRASVPASASATIKCCRRLGLGS